MTDELRAASIARELAEHLRDAASVLMPMSASIARAVIMSANHIERAAIRMERSGQATASPVVKRVYDRLPVSEHEGDLLLAPRRRLVI